jgi:type II secretory pathway pseudopilin PulG
LLVAIVVVGILTAVAIVGIGGLTSTAHKASCKATADSARAGLAAYYAAQTPNAYPATFADLVTQKDLDVQGGVTVAGADLKSDGTGTPSWTITLGSGGTLTSAGADSAGCTA